LQTRKETVNNISFEGFQEALSVSAIQISNQLASFLPSFIGAICIIIIGFILGKWAKAIVVKGLELINLSKLVKNTAVTKFLEKADIQKKIEVVLGEAVRWFVIAIFFIAGINTIGLTTVSEFLYSVLLYIPQIISAMLILAAGVLVAGWVESFVKGAVGAAALATGRLLGKIASYTVIVFAILAAISELGIAEKFITTLFIGFVAMLSLGMGLAFGLGAKDLVAKILNDWYKQFKKDTK
jgi:hypothetical protein